MVRLAVPAIVVAYVALMVAFADSGAAPHVQPYGPHIAGRAVATGYGSTVSLLSKLEISSIVETSSGRLWFALDNQELYFLDPGDVEVRQSEHQLPQPPEMVCHSDGRAIFVESSPLPGVGHLVDRFDGTAWSALFASDLLTASLGGGAYNSAVVNLTFPGHRGRVWFGVYCGDWCYLVSYDEATWSAYRVYFVPRTERHPILVGVHLGAGLEASDGTVWFATGRSILMLDTVTGAVTQQGPGRSARDRSYPQDTVLPSQEQGGSTVRMYEDRKGRLWFGTLSAHLLVYDRTDRSWTTYWLPGVLANELKGKLNPPPWSPIQINQIYEDTSGLMMVATNKGLIAQSTSDGK
jgi:hypothetical protein